MLSGGAGYLLAVAGCGVALAGIFYRLWRGGLAKLERLERELLAMQRLVEHSKRLQDTVDKSRKEGEKREQEVIDEAREGRRDHFDNTG